eukprot:138316-Prymnesium_polylepis.1
MSSRRERRHSARLPPRPDTERIHRGRHRRVAHPHEPAIWPKRSIFAPRGTFGRGGAMTTGGQNRDPMPSGTPASPRALPGPGPAHHARSALPPIGIGGA